MSDHSHEHKPVPKGMLIFLGFIAGAIAIYFSGFRFEDLSKFFGN